MSPIRVWIHRNAVLDKMVLLRRRTATKVLLSKGPRNIYSIIPVNPTILGHTTLRHRILWLGKGYFIAYIQTCVYMALRYEMCNLMFCTYFLVSVLYSYWCPCLWCYYMSLARYYHYHFHIIFVIYISNSTCIRTCMRLQIDVAYTVYTYMFNDYQSIQTINEQAWKKTVVMPTSLPCYKI